MKSDRRILLMYISEHSGHHLASLAVEHALFRISPQNTILNINAFNYTNPILEKMINKAYMGVIRRTPEIWDYLYDNPKVVQRTRRLRTLIHSLNSPKLKRLLDEFKPDVVACTQAFPCGMVADYKKTHGLSLPLVGILTDYVAHSYWMYSSVDRYIVPSAETASALLKNGIEPERIKILGIPIEPKFHDPVDRAAVFSRLGLEEHVPTLLVMGGTQGLGPIKEFSRLLDSVTQKIQTIIVCGTNTRLFSWLGRHKSSFRHPTLALPFVSNIDELMGIATLIVTKAGGITTAEALARSLPMLIMSPLPGQEAMNTSYLIREGVAIRAGNTKESVLLLEELLDNPSKLRLMGENARRCSKPLSALEIARLIQEL